MASLQRRRGVTVRFHKTATITDLRGNETVISTPEYHEVRAAIIPNRSSRAEVPGQMAIDVVDIITTSDLSGVNIWSRVEMDGRWWDCVSPPTVHYGTPSTYHWTVTVRNRADDGGNETVETSDHPKQRRTHL